MDRDIFGSIAFCSFGLFFTTVEFVHPARSINYRAVLKDDLIALGLYQLLFFLPTAGSIQYTCCYRLVTFEFGSFMVSIGSDFSGASFPLDDVKVQTEIVWPI